MSEAEVWGADTDLRAVGLSWKDRCPETEAVEGFGSGRIPGDLFCTLEAMITTLGAVVGVPWKRYVRCPGKYLESRKWLRSRRYRLSFQLTFWQD